MAKHGGEVNTIDYPSSPTKPPTIEIRVSSQYRVHVLLFTDMTLAKRYLEAIFGQDFNVEQDRITVSGNGVTAVCDDMQRIQRALLTNAQRNEGLPDYYKRLADMIKWDAALWEKFDALRAATNKKQRKKPVEVDE